MRWINRTLPWVMTTGLALAASPAAHAGLLTPFLHSTEPAIEGGAAGDGESPVVAGDLNPCERLFQALLGGGDPEQLEGLSEAELQALYESMAQTGEVLEVASEDGGSVLCSPLGMTAGGLGVGGLLAASSGGSGGSGSGGSAASSTSSVSAAEAPVPEPAGGALFALGSLVAGWSVRRRS
jgi:hypothetical protein